MKILRLMRESLIKSLIYKNERGRGMKKINLLILVCFLGLMFFMTGCTITASDSTTRTYYYYPDWTPGGKILCSKGIVTSTTGPGPTPGTDISGEYYLTIMDEKGSNEANVKRINNPAKVAASPLGNYYAYAETGSNFLKVVDTSGNDVISIDCSAQVDSLDWSPDESKLVYGTKTSATSEVYTINRDGTSKNILAIGENVAWRYGEYIAFDVSTPEGKTLSVIKNDGASLTKLRIGYIAQFISADKILYNYVPQVRQVNIDGTQDIELFSGYLYRESPKISYNKTKLVAMDANNGHGIYVINITGTGEVQLR